MLRTPFMNTNCGLLEKRVYLSIGILYCFLKKSIVLGLILYGLFGLPSILSAADLKGKIHLSEDWSPMVYLSVINAFDQLNTASYDFLRYQTEIDEEGYFEFIGLELAEDDLIYRLHICKKGDPVSTILIGGQEENFIHFVMNNRSKLSVIPAEDSESIQHCRVEGHPASKALNQVLDLQKELNAPLAVPSAQNRSFVKNKVLKEWVHLAHTATNAVVRLFAFHCAQDLYADDNQLPLMENLYNDLALSGHESPYFTAFENQLTYLQFQENQALDTPKESWLQWLLLGLGVCFLSIFYWFKLKTSTNKMTKSKQQNIQALSSQEKKVFRLLKEGKSNKEISSELHIEVSTVKSHLNKIYSRLGVKSRKEIVNKEV